MKNKDTEDNIYMDKILPGNYNLSSLPNKCEICMKNNPQQETHADKCNSLEERFKSLWRSFTKQHQIIHRTDSQLKDPSNFDKRFLDFIRKEIERANIAGIIEGINLWKDGQEKEIEAAKKEERDKIMSELIIEEDGYVNGNPIINPNKE